MNNKGLTFIELLITITIISVLASVVIPLSHMTVKRQQETELRRSLRVIRNALDEYKKAWDDGNIKKNIGESGYPPELIVLVEGVKDIKAPKERTIKFLRRIPRDPMNPDKDLDPEESWGLRSYKSDYDDPEEGDDVYDVYTESEETAIDGTPYSEW